MHTNLLIILKEPEKKVHYVVFNPQPLKMQNAFLQEQRIPSNILTAGELLKSSLLSIYVVNRFCIDVMFKNMLFIK